MTKINTTIYIYIILLSFFFSCGNKVTQQKITKTDSVNISIENVQVKRIKLDSVPTSFEVQTSIVNNSIALIDKYFCYLYMFTSDGHLKKKLLGQGNAKNETTIGKIAGHCFSNDGRLYLIGFQGDTHVYDSSINLEKVLQTDYSQKSPMDLKNTDCYNKPIDYTKCYDDLTCIENQGKVYLNVSLITPIYNIVSTPKVHIKNVYNLMSIDITGKHAPELLIKGLPPYYYTNTKSKAPFSNCHFDIDNKGNIYVAHEADSLIYIYNKNGKLLSAFGVSGRNMKQDYAVCSSLEDFGKLYQEEHNTMGRYTSLKYIEATGILLRTYQQGDNAVYDRMQIYKDNILIGDVTVPKKMKIAGYIQPYYFSQVMAEDNESNLYVYKFKL